MEDITVIRSRLLAAAALAPLLLTSAPSLPAVAADPPITLRLATPEVHDRPSQPFLDRFAAEVAALSRGSMTVEVIYEAGGHVDDKEPIAARRVQSGDVQLAVIPTRAWADAGVTSVQALMAPFLIDNDALLRAVATEETVLQPMLDGMAEQGLIGLVIWPENLRHLFTFDENGPPILEPSDLVGQTMFVIGSALQNQIMRALGATPSNVYPPDVLVRDGTLRGAEYSLWNYNLYSPATVTADVVFYPKYQTLVAEDAAWSRLSEEQQRIVQDAAATARDAQMSTLPDSSDLVTTYCAQGGRAVLAGEANVAAFQAAGQPIYDRMREDGYTSAAIDAITALKAVTTPGPTVEACEPTPHATAAPAASGPPVGLVPDGTYKLSHTKQELVAAGLTAQDASNNAGDWTWRFDGTRGSWALDHPDGFHEAHDATYEVLGDRVRMNEGSGGWHDFRWTLDGDQLRVTVLDNATGTAYDVAAEQAILGGPWTKVE
jgi:TRAP-type C4-dicarboxylate transport system substrate-binding protein